MKTLRTILFLFFITLLSHQTRAGLNIPYAVDSDTLHLWHFDDSTVNQGTANFVVVTDAVTTASLNMTNYGMGSTATGGSPNTPPYTNIFLVNQGATANLKSCLNILPGGGAAGKAYAWCGTTNNIGGYFPDTTSFRNITSGAFTFEALVYIQGPVFSTTIGAEWEIFCGDSQGEAGGRAWQFRIQPGAVPSLNMNFITQTGGTVSPNQNPSLPTSGPNALAVSNWYHVAVTFTGNAPTNSDTPGVLRFYWTLFDAFRTNADLLASFTNSAYGTLGGAPIPAIGGSGRRNNGVGNAGAFEGLIDEVRISDIARSSGQMVFVSGGAQSPPIFTAQPAANTLVGYGQTLSVPTLISGSPTIFTQWQKTNSNSGGWTNEPGQTASTLLFNSVIFGNAGFFRLIATNNTGSATSQVARVTLGAVFSELFNTGFDTNGLYETVNLPNNPDPHYTLIQSGDVTHLGPNAIVWNMFAYPIAANGGFFANPDGASQWVGPQANSYTSPQGQYVYRETFLLDSVDLTQAVKLQGTWWTGNQGADILLNGVSTGNTSPINAQSTGSGFVITNGFKAGLNTLDFAVPLLNPNGSYQEAALRVEVSGIGQALAPGKPAITNQPVAQTVADGSVDPTSLAKFSVVAVGRPPLSYQWYADGAPVSGATMRTLTFVAPLNGAQGTNFSVVISNDSGSVTSSIAKLTVLATNQFPLAPSYTYVIYSNTTLSVSIDSLYNAASDPDADPLSITWDGSSTNGGTVSQNGIALSYTPVTDFVGADQFSYHITDSGGATTDAAININVVPLQAPAVSSTSKSGNSVVLQGLGGSAGGSYTVFSSTNLTLSLTNWTLTGTGAFDGAGHFNFTNAITPGVGQKFFIISVP